MHSIERKCNMKNYIVICLIFILIFFFISVCIKCNILENENLELKQNYSIVIDSIKIENESLEREIEDLSIQLNVCHQQIDSLNKIKQKIIVKYKTEYIISDNITEGVQTLKNNIKCERYY